MFTQLLFRRAELMPLIWPPGILHAALRSFLTPAPAALLFLRLAGAGVASGAPRHLFLDPGILASAEGSALKVNPAQRHETAIFPDRPWEKHMISFFLTVRDEGGKLRMWYVCRDGWGDGSQA